MLLRSEKGGEARVLGRYRVGFEVAVEAFPPDGVEPFRVQTGKEIRARRTGDAVRRIETIALAQETPVVRRMPILAGIHPAPRQIQEPVDRRNNFEPSGHGQLTRAQAGKALLRIDDKQTTLEEPHRFHISPCGTRSRRMSSRTSA